MKNEKITHIDLFSGIGGFSLAADRVFGEVDHTFVEWDGFCQEVLRKHWPQAEMHSDIHAYIAYAESERSGGEKRNLRKEKQGQERLDIQRPQGPDVYLLTGGFPCQPFSHAGRRRGTADDRYKWPQMLECVSLFRPEWVVAENVAGLASWNDGLVLETVCSDLEAEGYEVQPLIIPAAAVGAPHRRDRIWIVANRKGKDGGGLPERKETPYAESGNPNSHAQEPRGERRPGRNNGDKGRRRRQNKAQGPNTSRDRWQEEWIEAATRLCRVDDGVPRRLDRNPRLKALGNAIVPQVAEEILKAIKLAGLPSQ